MAYKLLDMAQARGDGSTARTSCRSCGRASRSWTGCSTRPSAAQRARGRQWERRVGAQPACLPRGTDREPG